MNSMSNIDGKNDLNMSPNESNDDNTMNIDDTNAINADNIHVSNDSSNTVSNNHESKDEQKQTPDQIIGYYNEKYKEYCDPGTECF